MPGHGVPGKILTAGCVEAVRAVGVDTTWRSSASHTIEVPRLVPRRRRTVECSLSASSDDLVAWIYIYSSSTC